MKTVSAICLITGLALLSTACRHSKESYPIEKSDLTGSWEVAGFVRSDGISSFAGQVFDNDCRQVVFNADGQITVTGIPGGNACFTGSWAIIGHNGNNLHLEGQGAAVEWAVDVVTESGNQLTVREGDIEYNLIRQ